MRTKSISARIGLAALILSLTLASPGWSQEVVSSLTVLFPADALASPRQVVVLVGPPKAPITVGDCMPGEFRPQDVEIRDRVGDAPPTRSEVIVIDYGYRNQPVAFNGVDLDAGTLLGSFRGGGQCGPGYAGYTAHVLMP